MELYRSKEVRRMLWAMGLIAAVATAVVYPLSPAAAAVVGVACLLLGAVFLGFTRWRYRQLARLGAYLRQVNSGQYSMELPDNDEGELSILQSEIYKVTVALREQNGLLQRDKRRLADALSDISHQFKTPLTSMSVMIDLLAEGQLEEGRRAEFTAHLRGQLERLTWLTEALLKLSKLDAESVAFSLRPVALGELVDRACAPLLIPMELREQTLDVQAAGSVFCDLGWTAEALTNILKNCVEHTPVGGSIRIAASENPLFSEIRVSDTGPGFDRDDWPHLFDRFYRGRHAGKDSVGIGLAMSQAIVTAQGGTLEAGRPHRGGAEFTLRFPSGR